MNLTVTISVGEDVYDVTGKSYDELPDKVKAALVPAQNLYARLLLDNAFREFREKCVFPDKRDAFDALPKSEQERLFAEWFNMQDFA